MATPFDENRCYEDCDGNAYGYPHSKAPYASSHLPSKEMATTFDENNREVYSQEISPFTITEVNQLFDDLCNEIYYGFNFKLVMMQASDRTMSALRILVDEAKAHRNPNIRECHCLSLMEDHFNGAKGCAFNEDWTARDVVTNSSE